MKQNQKFNPKLNPKLIFLGTLLLVVTFAFIVGSGCITTPQDANYELQPFYKITEDDDVITIRFYDDNTALIYLETDENILYAYGTFTRESNLISGTLTKMILDNESIVMHNTYLFQFLILDSQSGEFYFNDYYVVMRAEHSN